eukprot:CAMPEP_0170510540 /NCGR_PEP_ID=MMETSP0208-20121228/65822_1 /TAXON_ID=197538 /ORGANISM="Strombidium inclinatum, Strain S3" /LENGTH=63 /DNA_ID=CAMNT_0010794011 /DNA_START=783 /DNA_END=974 /DNA_ORIENTATION=-
MNSTLEVLDTTGLAKKFKLKPGQRLLLQDPMKPNLTILTDDLINQIDKATMKNDDEKPPSFLD